MRINFRQGLISYQKDSSSPDFLQASSTSGFVSHVVSPTPTVIAVAHGDSDYLIQFNSTIDLAWGPMISGQTNYLYWDVDLLTADVTRGITTLPPITNAVPPAEIDGQHWFDTSTTTMKVWSAAKNKWQTKIRVFAGQVNNGNTNTIISQVEGSQVSLIQSANPGFIMRDHLLNPLRNSEGGFLTDDSSVYVSTSAGTSGVLVQPVNRIVPVKAGETIPAMSLVYFSGDDIVRLASSNPALVPQRIPVGIVLEQLMAGDVGHLSPFGEISYDQWDWTGHAGEPLYIDFNGALTLTRPTGLLAYRVGFIKNKTTVLLGVDAETYPQVYTADVTSMIVAGQSPVQVSDVVNGLGERTITISVPNVGSTAGLMTVVQANMLSDLDVRVGTAEDDIDNLTATKAEIVHSHVISDVSGLHSALDSKAAASHTHSEYALVDHDHDSRYSQLGHTHDSTDISGLQTLLSQKANRAHLNAFNEIYESVDRTGSTDSGSGGTLTDVLEDKADVVHVHVLSDITNLQIALDDKANLIHVHSIADVTDLQTELDNRAFVIHTHSIANITGLQAALDNKSNLNHTHDFSDISGLQETLDGKTDVGHTHVTTDITDLAAVAISGSYNDLTDGPTLTSLTAVLVNANTLINLTNDDYICVLTNTASRTVVLPPGVLGKIFIIKDGAGTAATNVITVVPDGSETIDAQSNFVSSTNFEAITIVWNGVSWSVL